MKVYALVGKSGTGKSYQAVGICRQYGISMIVDDGLLIYENRVEAGTSAKRQATKIGAIKTALFTGDEHRRTVMEAIKRLEPESILLLGTSDNMVKRIGERLNLPTIQKTVYIEEITTEGERHIAHKQRHELGKHVIPAPTFQIKRQFSGYFLDPLRIFRDRGKEGFAEKTVVRPTYSYLGEYIIADRAIADIIRHIGTRTEGVVSVLRADTVNTGAGVEITVLVIMEYGVKLIEAAKTFQKNIGRDLEQMTAFNIDVVNVEIRGVK